jgi:hypothetical protein
MNKEVNIRTSEEEERPRTPTQEFESIGMPDFKNLSDFDPVNWENSTSEMVRCLQKEGVLSGIADRLRLAKTYQEIVEAIEFKYYELRPDEKPAEDPEKAKKKVIARARRITSSGLKFD